MLIESREIMRRFGELLEQSTKAGKPIEHRFGILECENVILTMVEEEGNKIYEEYKKNKPVEDMY